MSYGTINPELLGLAKQNLAKAADDEKAAFVQAGDPMMDPMAGGGGAPPMDPMMGGGPPPGGPPMDPMAGGPPMDPMAGGAPPMDPMAALQPMIQQAVQAAMGGAGGGDGGQIKPKIDVNIEIMQIKKILAKISDALGITIPAADMVATPEDLTAMAQGNSAGAGALEGGGGPSAISPPSPIEPMGAAAPAAPGGAPKQAAWENGTADAAISTQVITDELQSNANVASAWLSMQSAKRGG